MIGLKVLSGHSWLSGPGRDQLMKRIRYEGGIPSFSYPPTSEGPSSQPYTIPLAEHALSLLMPSEPFGALDKSCKRMA